MKKKVLVFLMILLTVSATVFAANYEKDCKLDLNRWLMLEEYPTGKYVKFFDSQDVSALDSNRFETTLCDYYYGGDCKGMACTILKVNNAKHYHVNKIEVDLNKKAYG